MAACHRLRRSAHAFYGESEEREIGRGRLGFGQTQAAAHVGVSLCRSEVVGVTVDCGLVCKNVGSSVAKSSRECVDALDLRGSRHASKV
jgi:hypothetical protein